MHEAIPPLPQYAFMAWCSVKAQGQLFNLDLVAVQKVRWVEGGSQPADYHIFFYGNGNNHHLGRLSHTCENHISSYKGRIYS
jgi:hypothetical protein